MLADALEMVDIDLPNKLSWAEVGCPGYATLPLVRHVLSLHHTGRNRWPIYRNLAVQGERCRQGVSRKRGIGPGGLAKT
jgi:hypothetical protein